MGGAGSGWGQADQRGGQGARREGEAEGLPVAVIGAGPVGLAAAAHLAARGQGFVVLEAAPSVGAHVRAWGHVQMFSPWRFNVDPTARSLLVASGWIEPVGDALPTGAEIAAGYLEPLAKCPEIAPYLRLGTRVMAVARSGHDKVKSAGRDRAPFELHLRTAAGEERLLARAVIDASGTYGVPSPLGGGGRPAIGEEACRDRIFYGIPDVLGAARARYAGRSVAVVGSGHSAFNVLLDLARLAESESGTTVTWVVRRAELGSVYGGGAADALPARGDLGERLRALVRSGRVRLVTGFGTSQVRRAGAALVLLDAEGRVVGPVDEIVAVTGFRPDPTLLAELRVDLDPALESPRALAPLIDPNLHSCGTVPPHGAEELRHPEPGLFVVGMKSYGRAPTFLMLTGYEQVRSVVAELTGDLEGARRVELTLPATGVCSAAPAAGEGAGVDEPTTGEGTVPGEGQAGCCGAPGPALIAGPGRKA